MATITRDPRTTARMGMSRSIRLVRLAGPAALDSPAPSARTSFNPARRAEMIVGIVRSSVISPAAATAPAPMGRMYCRHMSSGVICGMGMVDG